MRHNTLSNTPGLPDGQFGSTKSVSRFPFLVVALLFAFEFIRPQNLLPALRPLQLPLIVSLAALLVWVLKGRLAGLNERLIHYAGAFVLICAVTVIFAPFTTQVYDITKSLSLYLVTGTLPIVAFVSSIAALTRFFRLWAVIHVILAVIVIAKGGTGPGSFLSDENDVAMALVMGLPFLIHLAKSRRWRTKGGAIFCYFGAFLIVLATMITSSRGGFVGLVAVLAFLWWQSRNRMRTLSIGLFLSLLGLIAAAPFLPEGYFTEMSTIADTSERTAQDRLRSWKFGLLMFADNPVLGVGAGNYPKVVQSYVSRPFADVPEEGRRNYYDRVAHSAYITALSELGAAGTILLLMLLYRSWREIRESRAVLARIQHEQVAAGDLALYGQALLGSLVGFLVCGAFLSVLYYPHLWWFLGFVIAFRMSSTEAAARGRAEEQSRVRYGDGSLAV